MKQLHLQTTNILKQFFFFNLACFMFQLNYVTAFIHQTWWKLKTNDAEEQRVP